MKTRPSTESKRVHSNGTAAADLFEELQACINATQEAMHRLILACPNARDYYLIAGAAELVSREHRERMRKLESVIGELVCMRDHVQCIADLEKQLAEMTASRDSTAKDWMAETQKAGKAMGDTFKVGQLEKQNRVIGHIAAGRVSEAILEILEPMPVLFKMDIRFDGDGGAQKVQKMELQPKPKD